MENIKFEYLPITELKPYNRNTRKHEDYDISQIMVSIQKYGFNDPIGIWSDQNIIVEGHGRLEAAKRLHMDEVPVIRLDHLTDEERREYGIMHNKTAELSSFDTELLTEEIVDLDFSDFEIDWNMPEIETAPAEVVEDEVPEVPEEAKTKLGDLWQLGEHRLICGDSTDPEVLDRIMDGRKADMVFTDPPYGVAIGDKNAVLNTVQPSGRCTENIENDTLSEEDLYDLLERAFVNIREHCEDDAVYFVTSPQGGSLGLMMMMMMRDAGLPVRHVLMWEKNSATFSLGRLDYDYQHEPIFYTWGKSHHNFRGGR